MDTHISFNVYNYRGVVCSQQADNIVSWWDDKGVGICPGVSCSSEATIGGLDAQGLAGLKYPPLCEARLSLNLVLSPTSRPGRNETGCSVSRGGMLGPEQIL